MIEADLPIACRGQGVGDHVRLEVAIGSIWKCGFINLALVFLERGYMRITKDREAVGTKPKAFPDRIET